MNAPFQPLYTNDVSPEYLRSLDVSNFTEQQIAQFSEQARTVVREQRAFIDAHPATAIYRCATEGSQTRMGGVIQRGTVPYEIALENGRSVRIAYKGDDVLYADGCVAQIVTGAGRASSDVALVGSLISNGDEIINTPQSSCVLVLREGLPMAEDFLPSIKEEEI